MPPARRDRIRCSDDRGHDRGDDRHAGADADADAHGNSDLAEREAPGGKADEAARKAENGDDLAARAFEEISEFGEGRIEGGVSAGISRTGTGERHESGQDIVLEPGTAGKLNRGIHGQRSEEHTSELQSLMRISYAGVCLK